MREPVVRATAPSRRCLRLRVGRTVDTTEKWCAGFCEETGTVGGRDRPAQSHIFNDLSVLHGSQKRPISFHNARVVGSIPISGNLISLHDPKYIFDDQTRGLASNPHVPEERSEVERAGEHIKHQFHVAVRAHFASNLSSFKRFAHGFATRSQNFPSNDRCQCGILCHVRGKTS